MSVLPFGPYSRCTHSPVCASATSAPRVPRTFSGQPPLRSFRRDEEPISPAAADRPRLFVRGEGDERLSSASRQSDRDAADDGSFTRARAERSGRVEGGGRDDGSGRGGRGRREGHEEKGGGRYQGLGRDEARRLIRQAAGGRGSATASDVPAGLESGASSSSSGSGSRRGARNDEVESSREGRQGMQRPGSGRDALQAAFRDALLRPAAATQDRAGREQEDGQEEDAVGDGAFASSPAASYSGRPRSSSRGSARDDRARDTRASSSLRAGPPSSPFPRPAAGPGAAAAGAAPPPPSAPSPAPLPSLALPVVRENDSDKGTFFHGSTFRQVGASSEVVTALRTLGISRPSHVQAEAYRLLLSSDPAHRHVAVMDQAGSGKTLAYLLPLLQLLKQEEYDLAAAAGQAPAGPAEGSAGKVPGLSVAQPGKPRLMVLAPTTELVQQVYRVAKAISASGLRFRSACMTGGHEDRDASSKSRRTQEAQLASGLDLLVTTPGRAASHLKSGALQLSGCKAVVLDEVDVLLGDQAAFRDQVQPLRAAAPRALRWVLVTATLPQHTLTQLRADFPDLSMASGPGLHRTAAGLEEELVDCSGGDEISLEAGTERKLEALMKVLSRRGAPRVLVFCNKIESCRAVENHLRRVDRAGSRYKVAVYHEAIRDDLRSEALHTFLQPVRANELPVVMVATDRMSRGIDSMYCEHVVLFDFPRDPSEYVRRVGRTARGAGGRGTVSVLVMGRQVPLAKDIMDKNQKGKPIHRLPEAE